MRNQMKSNGSGQNVGAGQDAGAQNAQGKADDEDDDYSEEEIENDPDDGESQQDLSKPTTQLVPDSNFPPVVAQAQNEQ